MFYFKILILICSYIFCQLPTSYHIEELKEINRSTLYSGWPHKSTLDLGFDSERNIFAGTSGGLAKIEVPNTSLITKELLEESQYIVYDSNLPEGGNPAMKTFELDNGTTLIVITGVIGTVDEPVGTGISWSVDNGENWEYMPQSIDSANNPEYDSGYIHNVDWGDQTFKHRAITTTVQNVSYDISADLENGYIYTASWAGTLRRFNYMNSDPSWEVVPLPNNSQVNLLCSNGTGFSDNYEYDPVLYDNHKPFSVLIEDGYIWVGTADGINKGEILDNNCIDWTHYQDIEQTAQFQDDWIIGLYSQNLEDSSGNIIKRIWAISWVDNVTPHNLTYTDDFGNTWNKKEGLRPRGAVTYNLYSNSNQEALYASTSTGLYKTIINGCNDPDASNFDNIENNACQYELIDNGCELDENYFYLNHIGSNEYELIYNSTEDIYNFSFDIEGASLLSYSEIDGFNISNENGIFLDAQSMSFEPISAGCGLLLTLELDGLSPHLENIIVNSGCFNYYTSGTYGEDCSDWDWHKIDIPDWIFNQIGIDDEFDSSFKVYSVIESNVLFDDPFNALWIGTNQGLFFYNILENNLEEEDNWLKPDFHPEYSKMIIFPNPFNLSNATQVEIYAKTSNTGFLEIYDFSMSKIYKGPCNNLDGDELKCVWKGKSSSGNKVANGIYFCKISAEGQIFWEKLGLVQFR